MIPHSRPWLTSAERDALQAVFESGQVAAGERCHTFAEELRRCTDADAVALAGSGTAALVIALTALNLPQGAEVVMPTYACEAVAKAITQAGLKPVLCDVGPAWNMTPATVAPYVNERTAALVLVSLFGIELDATLFRQFDRPLIHDLCQCFPHSRAPGTPRDRGDLLVFSFHATKMLCAAHGGAVARPAGRRTPGFEAAVDAYASLGAMSDLEAAVGLVQLGRYLEMRERRQHLAGRYRSAFPADALRTLDEALAGDAAAHVLFRFPLTQTVASFEAIAGAFAARGVIVRRGVDALLHRRAGLADELFPNAVQRFEQTVSVPFYPALSDEEADTVIAAQRQVWSEFGIGN